MLILTLYKTTLMLLYIILTYFKGTDGQAKEIYDHVFDNNDIIFKRNLGNHTGVDYLWPVVWDNTDLTQINSFYEYSGKFYASGIFTSSASSAFNNLGGNAFTMRLDSNMKVELFKIFVSNLAGCTSDTIYSALPWSNLNHNGLFLTDTTNSLKRFAVFRLILPDLDSPYAYGFSITSSGTPHGFHFSYYARMAFFLKTSTSFDFYVTTCTECSICNYQIALSGGTIYHSKNFLDTSVSYDLTSSFIAIDSSGVPKWIIYQINPSDCSLNYMRTTSVSFPSLKGSNYGPPCAVTSDSKGICSVQDNSGVPNSYNKIYIFKFELSSGSNFNLVSFQTYMEPTSITCTSSTIFILYTQPQGSNPQYTDVILVLVSNDLSTILSVKYITVTEITSSYMTYISNSLYIFINIRDAGTGSTSFTKATVYKYIDGTDSFDQTCYQWVNIGVFTQAAVTTTYDSISGYYVTSSTVITSSDETSIFTTSEVTSTKQVFLYPDSVRSGGSGICVHQAPYITTTLAASYSIYATDPALVLNLAMSTQIQGVPYNMTVIYTNGTVFAPAGTWYTADYSNFDLNKNVVLTFDVSAIGVFYLASSTYNLNFQIKTIEGGVPAVQDNFITIIQLNDPCLTTTITDQSLRVGEYKELVLSIQTNKTLNNSTGGIFVDCTYQDGTAFAGCYSLSLTSLGTIVLYSEDNTLSASPHTLQVSLWYVSTAKRVYNFTATYRTNTKPTFSSPPTSIQIICCADQTKTPAIATDAEGDTLYYKLVAPTLPFTVTCSDSSTGVLSISGLAVNLEATYTGFVYYVCENSNFLYCTSFSFSIDVINTIPVVNPSSAVDKTVVVYMATEISYACPWFTDAQGDTMTVNYTISPALPTISMTASNCSFALGSLSNSFADVYTITVNAYDFASNSTNHASFTSILTINQNNGPAVGTTLTDQAFTADRTVTYTIPSNAFSDPESETISLSLSFSPAASFISFNSATRVLTVAAVSSTNLGTYVCTVTATDSHPDTAPVTQTFNIIITGNLPPTTTTVFTDITHIALYPMSLGYDKSTYTDPNGDSITFTITNNMSTTWCSINTASLIVASGTPTNSDVGNYTITITASDPSGAFISNVVHVEIKTNHPPTTSHGSSITLSIYGLKTFTLNLLDYFTEPEGETMTYVLSSSPTWISIDSTAQTLTGIPPNTAASNAPTVTASDLYMGSVSLSITLNRSVNNGPYISPAIPVQYCYEGVRCFFNASNYIKDDAGDTISYPGWTITPGFFVLPFNSTTGIWDFVPTYSSIYSYYIVYAYAQDSFYPTTSQCSATFILYIYSNRAPVNNTRIPDQTIKAGYPFSYTFSSTLFSDPDGEPVTYSLSVPGYVTWLQLQTEIDLISNTTTFTLSGTPIPNNDARSFYIYIYADDNNTNSGQGSTYFYMTVNANQIPTSNRGLYNSVTSPIAFFPFSYTVPIDAFKDPEGEAITITASLLSNNFPITYDASSRIVTGTLTNNSLYGWQTIRFSVTDIWAVTAYTVDLSFYYYYNQPPVINTSPSSPACIIAHYPFSYSVPLTYFRDPENETLSFSLTTNQGSPKDSWILITTNSTSLIFSGTPTNLQYASFSVTLVVTDGHSNTSTYFTICVNQNKPPTMPGTATSISSGQVGFSWSYVYKKSWNSEPEGETISFTCTSNDTYSWISCSQNATDITFVGTPNSNTYAGNYNITVIASDPYSDVSKYNWTSGFIITVNNPPTIGTMVNKTLLAPDGLSWSYGSTLTSDPESLTYTKSLEVDGSATIPSWLLYNLSSFDFTVISSSNNIAGVHNITVIATDSFNPPVQKNFTLTIQYNQAPTKLMQIPSYGIVNFNLLVIRFNPITTLFQDPEGRSLTAKLTQGNGDPLPSFLSYNALTNVLSGTPFDVNIGEWPITYSAIDDEGNIAGITFKITVKPCYYKCTNCTTDDYNQCLSCKYGYYLQFNQCKEVCSGYCFSNTLTSTCDQCHPYCASCKDATQFNCQTCISPYFYFNNSCLNVCPDGYYGDTQTFTCLPCNPACTKCFGSSTNHCTACNMTSLYILSGQTNCILASCIRGSYLNKTDLNCYPCSTGCDVCLSKTYCDVCNPIYKMLTPGKCTYCNLIIGFKINEFGVCKEICGDGLNLGEYQCDDGNLKNGDGCSSTCILENGYTCEGIKCWEIIKPTGFVYSVSSTNLITIQFSEPVVFANYTLFQSNIRSNINGPSSPYTYDVSIFDPRSLLHENKEFKQLQIQVSNILASIYGSGVEKIEIWLADTSVLQDLNKNYFSDSKVVGNLRPYEYVPPATKQVTQSGGSSMQYTIISMFSINMLLKAVIKSSAATMWALIHVLQIFRYILLINISMPSIISVLIKYLGVVVGDIDEMQSMVPDIFNTYIVNSTELNMNTTIYPKFEINGYSSPYLTDSYGKQIITWTCIVAFGLPSIYLTMKLLKNCTWIHSKILNVWNGFFFNNPIRGFTEVFIEVSFCFFMNTLNINLSSRSGFITTIMMILIGAAVIMWSFILLNLVSFSPKYVRSKEFKNKFKTTIEDIATNRTLYQKAYYPLFVFERVVLTAIVVMFYQYTEIQLLAITVLQISVIGYLMAFKPFNDKLMNIVVCTDEFTIIFGMVIIFGMYINNNDDAMMLNLSYSIFGIIIVSIIKNLTITLYRSCTSIYKKCRRKIHKKINHRQRKRERLNKEKQERLKKELQEKDDEDLFMYGPRIGRKFNSSLITSSESKSYSNHEEEMNSESKLNSQNKNSPQDTPLSKLVSNLKTNSTNQKASQTSLRSNNSKFSKLHTRKFSKISSNSARPQVHILTNLQPITECPNEE